MWIYFLRCKCCGHLDNIRPNRSKFKSIHQHSIEILLPPLDPNPQKEGETKERNKNPLSLQIIIKSNISRRWKTITKGKIKRSFEKKNNKKHPISLNPRPNTLTTNSSPLETACNCQYHTHKLPAFTFIRTALPPPLFFPQLLLSLGLCPCLPRGYSLATDIPMDGWIKWNNMKIDGQIKWNSWPPATEEILNWMEKRYWNSNFEEIWRNIDLTSCCRLRRPTKASVGSR